MEEIPIITLEEKKDKLELVDRDNILEKLDNLRFYIRTPDQASRALLFSKKLRQFADLVEEKVKKRGSEIMSDEDLNEMEIGGFVIKKIEPTMMREYQASSVIDGLGLERAIPFLKVSTSGLEKYLIKARLEGDIMEKVSVGRKEKPKTGYIRISEKKISNNDK